MSFLLETIVIYVILYLIHYFGKEKTKKVTATIAIVWSALCAIASLSETETLYIILNLALNLFVLFYSLKLRKSIVARMSNTQHNNTSNVVVPDNVQTNMNDNSVAYGNNEVNGINLEAHDNAEEDTVNHENIPVGDCICSISGKIEDFEITIQGSNNERFRFKCSDGDIVSHMNLKTNSAYIKY